MKIHISAEGDVPYQTVKRRHGRTNVGLYCNNCHEFFAMAVHDKPPGSLGVEIVADGSPMFECPICHHKERRQPSEIAEIVLTEANKRRPPPSRGLN